MNKRAVVCVLILALAVVACGPKIQPDGAPTGTIAAASTATPRTISTTTAPSMATQVLPTDTRAAPADLTAAPSLLITPGPADCADADATTLGAAIAEDYAFTSTEQVMGWFCNGAEFEDIMVALETSRQTGASAEEMLSMVAAGLTWEEIWQVVGLTP